MSVMHSSEGSYNVDVRSARKDEIVPHLYASLLSYRAGTISEVSSTRKGFAFVCGGNLLFHFGGNDAWKSWEKFSIERYESTM